MEAASWRHMRSSPSESFRGLWHDDQFAELLTRRIHNRGRRFVGASGVERRLRVIFDEQLSELRRLSSKLFSDQSEGHVDPGGNTGGREDLAVAHDTLFRRYGAELFQDIESKLVRGGLQPLEYPGGGQP